MDQRTSESASEHADESANQHMRQRPTVNTLRCAQVCAPPSTPCVAWEMPSTFAPLWFFDALSSLQKGRVTVEAQRSQRKMP